jgi:amidohydrolase
MLNTTQFDKLSAFRKMLHRHPELSGKEFETQKSIVEFLEKETPAEIKLLATTGVLALFKSDSPGPTVLIRADIDALPIAEVNDFAHKSVNTGVSHKCGHDGHTTIVLGLAMLVSEQPITKGQLLLLFQPAEENGTGAEAVLKDPIFKDLQIDSAFSLHNLPGYASHQIVVKNNEFTANVKSIIIKMNGKTAHAAEPQNGLNPSLMVSEIFAFANQITVNNPESQSFFLMTPVYCKLGNENAFGVSAGAAEMHFTIRCWSTELMENRSNAILRYLEETFSKYQMQAQISWTEVFHASVNNLEAVEIIRKASAENQFHLTEKESPFAWGEDFGLFTQKYKGAMFGLGSGSNTPALHNPDYDYPDKITETGIRMFHSIIKQIL